MAHFRKFLPCVRYFSRAVLKCDQQTVSESYRKAFLNRSLLYISAQNFTVAVEAQENALKNALRNCSFWDVMTQADKKRDVYVYGMDYAVTQEQIESFFSGSNIEEIYTIDSSRAKIKKFFYVRFKDEKSKQVALQKHKQYCGKRYLDVCGIENPKVLGKSMLYQNSLKLKLANLPFGTQKEEVIEWLKPLKVREEDIFFLKRGECVVCLQDKASSAVASQKKESAERIGQRKIFVDVFVSKDDLGKLDTYCEEKTRQGGVVV